MEGNPPNWTDPSGECVGPLVILCAAAAGALLGGGAGIILDAGLQVADIAINQRVLSSFDWGQTLRSGMVGAVGGAFGGGFVAGGGLIAAGVGISASSAGATAAGVLTVGLSGVVGGRAATLTSNILSGRDALDDYWNPLSMARDAAFAIGGTWLFGTAANALSGQNTNHFTFFLPQRSTNLTGYSYSGAKGTFSPAREFDPNRAGGPIRRLNYMQARITQRGVEVVEQHISRFKPPIDSEVAGMVSRLRRIVAGDLSPDPADLRFYTHELREYVRYRRLGWKTGEPINGDEAYDLWNNTHTATLEDYQLNDLENPLFHDSVR